MLFGLKEVHLDNRGRFGYNKYKYPVFSSPIPCITKSSQDHALMYSIKDNGIPDHSCEVDIMNNEVMVSVYCLAYNHENFIEDALKGFVMQKTNFRYEVIVHDDASTDHTAEIIKKYADAYPDIIKPIFQKENQYSKGSETLLQFIFPKLTGKYIAMCEGDDYWTDEHKLQKQFDALESHPECDMCAHNADFYDCVSENVLRQVPGINENKTLPPEDVIFNDGGFLPTASLFYRRDIRLKPMRFQQFLNMDYTLQIRGSLRGGIFFLADNMSVYRWRVPGSWTSKISETERWKKFIAKKREMFSILNDETDHKYEAAITRRIRQDEFSVLREDRSYRQLFARKYREFRKPWDWSTRIKLLILAYVPFSIPLNDFYQKIKSGIKNSDSKDN